MIAVVLVVLVLACAAIAAALFDRSRFRLRAREPGVSGEHPFGVRIPPDKGDANYEGEREACVCVACGPPWRDQRPKPEPGTVEALAWRSWMALCPECGSKRCPGAADHTRHPIAPDAPETPHAPATAPNTTPRGSVDAADGSEALRADLASWIVGHYADFQPVIVMHSGEIARGLLPLVLAYGREQAARALRDAATQARIDSGPIPHADAGVWLNAAAWLEARADELGRQA